MKQQGKIHRLDRGQLPDCILNIPDAPTRLYYLGNLPELLHRPRLAVVGSRKVSPYGRAVTNQLVREAVSAGIVTISGLALGVDSIAHEATLAVGGQTIAIMPCGLDTICPTSHIGLAERILQHGGALVSEYELGTAPFKLNFIARNRLVSGFSDAVLITEAATKSGTLHTANFALEQGRTVLAVPGNITSELSGGTNNLIKAGATPITSTVDIFNAMAIEPMQDHMQLASNAEEASILGLLDRGVSSGSELLVASKLDVTLFNRTLTMLEIEGKIRALGGNNWSIA